jgi:iron complex transport system permease protein
VPPARTQTFFRRHPRLGLALLGVVLLASLGLSLTFGQLATASPLDLLRATAAGFGWNGGPDHATGGALDAVIWHVRMPRGLLAILVGANLAVAGVLMQALFYNPMAEPYVVGVSSGAALGAVLAVVAGMEAAWAGLNMVALAAFVGAVATTLIVYRVAERAGRVHIATLLLTGVAVGGILQAATTFLLLRQDATQIRSVLVWLMGSLALRGWEYPLVLVPYSIAGLGVAAAFHRSLDLLSAGEEPAHHLGLDVDRAKRVLLAAAALLAAASVATAGIVAFVGLIVPHAMRMLVGAGHRRLLPASALGGAVLVLWADLLARHCLPGEEIPIGVITGVLGCAAFLVLLARQRRRVF